jgi:sulfate adenylyltransferase subunit 1
MSAIEKLPAETVPDNGLLRFLTCGSVDDGKSTLIGRLLFDSKTILADTLHAIQRTSAKRGLDVVDLSLLTDGLQAEREQGITIDVAYRYFTTGTRKYIIADAPGHEQYTRNMVTAASTADLAIILIDARKGVLTQTRRHSYLAHLLGIRHIVVAVNKMDLVDYSPETFAQISNDYLAFAAGLGIADVRFIPMSALNGDMIVDRGERLDWYDGPTLLEILETAPAIHSAHAEKFRFPVQYVCRPQDSANPELHDYRGFMGRVESGELAVGDAVTVLPSGRETRVRDIQVLGESLDRCAVAEQSVTILLDDEIDISRGDMIVKSGELPMVSKQIDAMLCWLSESPLDPRRKYLLRHTTRDSKAMLAGIATASTSTAGTAGGRAAGDERYRPRQLPAGAADFRRSVHGKPRHRRLHRHRRVVEQYRRRRHDRLSGSTCRAASMAGGTATSSSRAGVFDLSAKREDTSERPPATAVWNARPATGRVCRLKAPVAMDIHGKPIEERIDWLFGLADRHSTIFRSPEAWLARERYLAEHPTAIAVLKCMDGRINIPVATNTPVGILMPFRNLGGIFDLGWPHLGEVLAHQVQRVVSAGRNVVFLVTYHYSQGDPRRAAPVSVRHGSGDRPHLRDPPPGRTHFRHRSWHRLSAGLRLRDRRGCAGDSRHSRRQARPGNLDFELTGRRSNCASPPCCRTCRHACVPICCRCCTAIWNISKNVRAQIRRNERLLDIEHREWMICLGRGFDFLHTPNIALIIGPYSPNLDVPIRRAAGIIEANMQAGRIPDDGFLLLASVPYDEIGVDRARAELKSRFLSSFAADVIRAEFPRLGEQMSMRTAVLDWRSRTLETIATGQ